MIVETQRPAWRPYGQGVRRLVPVSGGMAMPDDLEYWITHLELTLDWDRIQRCFCFRATPMHVRRSGPVYSSAWSGCRWAFPRDGAKRFRPTSLAALVSVVDIVLDHRGGHPIWEEVQTVLTRHQLVWQG